MRNSIFGAVLCVGLFAFGCTPSPDTTIPPKKVKPLVPVAAEGPYVPVDAILTKNCLPCHQGATPAAGLDLSNYNGVMRGAKDGQVLTTGLPQLSKLVTEISGPKPAMPKGKPPLSAADVKVIYDWIQRGALNGKPKAR